MKTQKNSASVKEFLQTIEDDQKRKDTETVVKMMKKITKKQPKMWGPSIIGFDDYSYKRADGSEHAFFRTGLSPRKAALTLYIMPGYKDYSSILKHLGKYKLGKSCLYLKKLEDVDLDVLEELITTGYRDTFKFEG